jgi:hypothetical protein
MFLSFSLKIDFAIYEFIIIIGEINRRRISFEKKRDLLHVLWNKQSFFLVKRKKNQFSKKKIKT